MGYSFDGTNKKIQLTAGTTEVSVADMYSRWVDWFLTSDNSKYLPAMRNVGGDAVSETKDLGITFFLTNGWRVVPDAADHRLILTGNFYTDPSGYSPIDTVSGYSIVVEYSVSNLVDSSFAQMDEIQYSLFNEEVTIDSVNGYDIGDYDLVGTRQYPVKTLAEAITIAEEWGFKTLSIVGDFTFESTDSISNYDIYGNGSQQSIFTFESGCILAYGSVYYATCTGLGFGITRYERCKLTDFGSSGLQASSSNVIMRDCRLSGSLAIPSNYSGKLEVLNCKSDNAVPANAPILDWNGSAMELIITDFGGCLKNINCSNADAKASIGLAGAGIYFDSTVTNGSIMLKGHGCLH